MGAGPAAAAAAMYSRDRASQGLGIEIAEVAAGRAVVTMTVGAEHTNGLDVCHGGLLFTLADTAMAFASNSHNVAAFATSAGIDFVRPATVGDQLSAEATEVEQRGKSAIYDVVVRDQDGETVAVFRGRTLAVGGPLVAEAP